MPASKTQVDRLGDRLKGGSHTEADLRLLDDYRGSFGDAYEMVVQKIRGLGLAPTGRPAKTTESIVAKLQREHTRLSRMQDIAGCRVVVPNVWGQNRVVEALHTAFPESSVVDRRVHPSHGYRAVHIIAKVTGKPVEIQVRSELQHLWAALSEKASDLLDPAIKYGGGPEDWGLIQKELSVLIAIQEDLEIIGPESVDQTVALQNSRRDLERSLRMLIDTFEAAEA